jgi:single-strand DNA-binding protein
MAVATRGLNKLHLIGYLGRDPAMRYTPAGKAVTNFSLAVGRVTGGGEQRQEETEWFRVVAWDKLGEACNEYLRKGSRVYVVKWTT